LCDLPLAKIDSAFAEGAWLGVRGAARTSSGRVNDLRSKFGVRGEVLAPHAGPVNGGHRCIALDRDTPLRRQDRILKEIVRRGHTAA